MALPKYQKMEKSGAMIILARVAYGNAVTVANGQLLAVGMNGAVSYSTNAMNWSDVYSQDHRVWLYDAIFANSRYVAVGVGGLIVSSANLRDY